MTKPIAMFVLSGLISAALQLGVSSCETEDSCECPAAPELPEQRAAEELRLVKSYSDSGAQEAFPFDLREATIEIANKQVLIRYVVDSTDRAVTYDIERNN